MTNTFKCSRCRHSFEAEDSLADQTSSCAACERSLGISRPKNLFARSARSDFAPLGDLSVTRVLGTLFCMLVLIWMSGGVVAAMFVPAVTLAREAARQNQCINNAKNIGLAFHNHHDVHKRLPLASSEPVTGIPGKPTGENQAGFSWIVSLLPFLEEPLAFDQLMEQSPRYSVPPFDPSFVKGETPMEVACEQIAVLRCPSSPVAGMVNTENSDYEEYETEDGKRSPGISSYLGMTASHSTTLRKSEERIGIPGHPKTYQGDGAMVFPPESVSGPTKGLGFKFFTDGTSKTFLVCESREPAYSAWIDGQAVWAIGAWPGNDALPSLESTVDGFLGWGEKDESSKISLVASLDMESVYMKADRFGGSHDRQYGPSGRHAEARVAHLFVDGHVKMLGPEIDRNVYVRSVTRSGGEPVLIE